MKKCSKCGEVKDLSEFNTSGKLKSGLSKYQSSCKVCKKNYREFNKEKIKQRRQQYEKENAEVIAQRKKVYRELNREKLRQYRKDHRSKAEVRRLRKAYSILYNYGITLEQAEELYSRGCEICGSNKKLCIDHCHESGEVRGCLCDLCNRGLGFFRDSGDFLKKALVYLNKTKETN